ncbi:MAG: hypothetical protein IT378_07035 [Sandaracinaceae bacterium]|nr:hypothetical protein [Sandaracinaceae bacterium]
MTTDLVLVTLFDLARAGVPADCALLAARLGASHAEVAMELARLDRAGLANASRCRLTLVGLARAASARARADVRARAA